MAIDRDAAVRASCSTMRLTIWLRGSHQALVHLR